MLRRPLSSKGLSCFFCQRVYAFSISYLYVMIFSVRCSPDDSSFHVHANTSQTCCTWQRSISNKMEKITFTTRWFPAIPNYSDWYFSFDHSGGIFLMLICLHVKLGVAISQEYYCWCWEKYFFSKWLILTITSLSAETSRPSLHESLKGVHGNEISFVGESIVHTLFHSLQKEMCTVHTFHNTPLIINFFILYGYLLESFICMIQSHCTRIWHVWDSGHSHYM